MIAHKGLLEHGSGGFARGVHLKITISPPTKVVLERCEAGRFSQSRMMAAARAALHLQPALTARACTRTPSSRACRCAQSMRSWCCNSAALRPHRSPASPPSVVPLPPAPLPADAVVRALSGSRPRGGGSSVGPGRAARLEDGIPNRVPILSFCSFLPVSEPSLSRDRRVCALVSPSGTFRV